MAPTIGPMKPETNKAADRPAKLAAAGTSTSCAIQLASHGGQIIGGAEGDELRQTNARDQPAPGRDAFGAVGARVAHEARVTLGACAPSFSVYLFHSTGFESLIIMRHARRRRSFFRFPNKRRALRRAFARVVPTNVQLIVGMTKLAPSFTPEGQRAVIVLVLV